MKKLRIRSSYFFTISPLLLFMLTVSPVRGQITGLDGWTIFLDPGHSQTENMGLYNYSEAEKVLRVAWELRDMFENQTDISEVHLSRLTDDDYISLEARTTLANELGVDFYYSIHSDAGSPSDNSTLTLYGGWRNNGETIEKTPKGGAAYGDILHEDLSGAMRIPTRGNWADRNFYNDTVDTHDKQWPYLHVNRTTNMPSLLSEGGFHTNPEQQQLNLNAEWKRLEALSAFLSFLEFHEIDRPEIGVVTGIITDEETGIPANGVTVTIGDKEYTTDSYTTLFNQYSSDPDKLHNGFYWIDGLTPGEEVEVVFTSDDFENKSVIQTVASNPNGRTHEKLTFADVALTSTVPAVVKAVNPEDKLEELFPGTNVEIVFSRKMDQASVEKAISISPEAELRFSWDDEFTLVIETGNLDFDTKYTLTIDGNTAKNAVTGQFLDGNTDGTEGGDYQIMITTSPEDKTPPQLLSYTPNEDTSSKTIRPVVRLVFDEEIIPESISPESIIVASSNDGVEVSGTISHSVVKEQSVIHFFPEVDLKDNAVYDVTVGAGLEDASGNSTQSQEFSFSTLEETIENLTVIDDFNTGITGWWEPQQSGSTTGIVTELTGRSHEQELVVASVESTGSMNLSYGWAEGENNYIRLYLPPGSAQNENTFGPDDLLQVYLFGDGSGNAFRFMIKDGENTYEASPWYTVDWIGWKLVSWDLTNDPAYGWVNGDGVIDGNGGFYLDGFHFAHGDGGDLKGNFYFDNLQFVSYEEATNLPDIKKQEQRVQMYPNPVRDKLTVKADWQINEIFIFNLNGQLVAGESCKSKHITLDMGRFSTGYYLIRVIGKNEQFSQKILIEQ